MIGLSAAQSEMWLGQQLEPESAKCNASEYIAIDGPVDADRFADAVRRTLAEVDSLNVRYTVAEDGSPRQIPVTGMDFPFQTPDLTEAADPDAAAQEWMVDETARVLDLDRAPGKGALLRVGARRHVWYQCYHHATVDAYGMSLIARRVAETYAALGAGTEPGPTPFGALTDVLADDSAYTEDGRWERDRAFWRDYLADWSGPCLLAGTEAPAAPTAIRLKTRLSEAAAAALHEACARYRVSPARLVTAATAVYLRHATRCSEVTLGFVLSARERDEHPVTMSNIVPLRVPMTTDDSIRTVIDTVSTQVRKVKPHQLFRGEEIRRRCLPDGTAAQSYGPLVNVLPFDYGFPFDGMSSRGMHLSTGPIDDISFSLYDRCDGGGLVSMIQANPHNHTPDQAADHLRRFLLVFERMLELPADTPIHQITITAVAEPARMLRDYSAGPPAETGETVATQRIDTLIAEQARRRPDATAVVCGDVALSYAALDDRAARLAARLAGHGVRRGDLVAVALEHDQELVVALLAVWKAGAAYLPIGEDQPAERLAKVLDQARPAAALTCPGTHDRLAGFPGRIGVHATDLPTAEPDRGEPGDLAYVMYTSGSTGLPKGVAVGHPSLHTYLRYATAAYPGLVDRSLVHSPISFDLTVTGLFGPLVSGGTVTLLAQLGDAASTEPTFLKVTPAHLPLLTHTEGLGPVSALVVGGAQLHWSALAAWRAANPDVPVFNEYGPTEATVGCCVRRVEPGETGGTEAVPVGRPIPGARLYVLDGLLRPLPPGFTGELYIAGDGVAAGYYRDPERTAERFLVDPNGPPESRMYRTGDLARWRTDGDLEYLGRMDDQVKVRGYRIELGEIESVLADHPGVVAAAARVEQVGDDQRIVGHVQLGPGEQPDDAALRDWCTRRLPSYMVPWCCVPIDAIPLSTNGKVDRNRLPSLGRRTRRRRPGAASSAECTLLCGLFADVLGLDEVGPDDDFVDLGGSSLTAVRLAARVREVFGAGFDIAELFRLGSPQRLARKLTSGPGLPPVERAPQDERVPLSFAQQRLWYLAQLHGDTGMYHMSRAHRLHGGLDEDVLHAALGDVLARHDVLRTVIHTERGKPYQTVLPVGPGWYAAENVAEEELTERVLALSTAPFDLARDFPVRARLLRVHADDHVLLLTVHHGVADASSLALLYRDLTEAFTARAQGNPPNWAPLPLRYSDYAHWQRTVLPVAEPTVAQERYWQQMLADAPECSGPALDHPRPAEASNRGGHVAVEVAPDVHAGLAQLARLAGSTPFTVVHAALLLVLRSLDAPQDMVIGTPVSGRTDENLADVVGCFLNMVPLRTRTTAEGTVGQLLAAVRGTDLAALSHAEVPFDRIVELLRPPRNLVHHPVFQVTLSFNDAEVGALCLGEAQGGQYPVPYPTAKFDLGVDLTRRHAPDGEAAGLTGFVEYAVDLYDPATAVTLAKRFERICTELAGSDPDRGVADVTAMVFGQKVGATS